MRSFDKDGSKTVTGPLGQLVHRDALEQSKRLARKFTEIRPGVWCLVGNGLSNQTFIEGPEGIIAIDTGESNEEMRSALQELRAHTSRPIAAVMYTHFHYVSGTREVFTEAGKDLPVYGHERIRINLSRVSSEIAPAYSSGIVHQFGLSLPAEGPDAIVNVGLGNFFRNPAHAPFTPGYVAPTAELHGGETLTVAGLKVEVTHAPSDADDSVTYWFPEIGVCVQNLVWPALFNVFAIRGEEYRDPQIVLAGIDHLLSLEPEHLAFTHGPSISGRAEISKRVTRYRDAIQFLWDQTVRGMNKGWTVDRITQSVVLPETCDEDYLTSEFYGVAEHHVRQIASGIRGWFDGDTAKIFPMEPEERASRLVKGFGGRAMVRSLAQEAQKTDDLRWALELASWLVASKESDPDDSKLLASILRDIGYRTTAANIRNWCLTKAGEVEGSIDLSRLRTFRMRGPVMEDPRRALELLRVQLDHEMASGIDRHICFDFTDGGKAGLHIRHGVSVATDGEGADTTVEISRPDWAKLLTGAEKLSDLLSGGRAKVSGDEAGLRKALACYELPGFRS